MSTWSQIMSAGSAFNLNSCSHYTHAFHGRDLTTMMMATTPPSSSPTSRVPPISMNQVPVHTESASLDLQTALEIARNTDTHVDGALDVTVELFLESELGSLIQQLRAAPDEYIMTKDEFALFNLFRSRFVDEDFTAGAIARFWDNYSGDALPTLPGANRGVAQTNGDGPRSNGIHRSQYLDDEELAFSTSGSSTRLSEDTDAVSPPRSDEIRAQIGSYQGT